MRVFISSTVYDLIDIRAEVADYLKSSGLFPILSDDKLSDFQIQHDVNSIETCLVNVRKSDAVIIILDKRYGASLKRAGYDDISATHLEYRTAIEAQKPIHFYVRDRLMADHTIWKRTKSHEELAWVNKPTDTGLFALIDEHQKLKRSDKRSNWSTTFTNSIDLKASIAKRFEKTVVPRKLLAAIQKNEFPLMDIDVDVDVAMTHHPPLFTFKARVKNVGLAPAFNVNMYWEAEGVKQGESTVFPPGKELLMSCIYRGDRTGCATVELFAEYDSAIGISVIDRFELGTRIVHAPTPYFASGGRLIKRRFTLGGEVSFDIEGLHA